MALSSDQTKFYWHLWKAVALAKPGVDRHEWHVENGLPRSMKDFGNTEFDRYKAAALAVTRPEDFDAQHRQVVMPETRWLVAIGHLLAALQLGEEFAEGIANEMNRGEKFGSKMHTLDSLPAWALEKVFIALKKECRREWPTKEKLLDALDHVRMEIDCDEEIAREAVLSALRWESMPPPHKMSYEPLLVVLGTLRRLVPAPGPRYDTAALAAEEAPF